VADPDDDRTGEHFVVDDADAPDVGDLTGEHVAIWLQEHDQLGRVLAKLCKSTGTHPTDHGVIMADLRGEFGAELGRCAAGDKFVQGDLARAALGGDVPAVAVPMPRDGPLLEFVREFLPELADGVLRCQPNVIPVVIVDRHDHGVLTFAEVEVWGLS
jgi:hypothetical protein